MSNYFRKLYESRYLRCTTSLGRENPDKPKNNSRSGEARRGGNSWKSITPYDDTFSKVIVNNNIQSSGESVLSSRERHKQLQNGSTQRLQSQVNLQPDIGLQSYNISKPGFHSFERTAGWPVGDGAKWSYQSAQSTNSFSRASEVQLGGLQNTKRQLYYNPSGRLDETITAQHNSNLPYFIRPLSSEAQKAAYSSSTYTNIYTRNPKFHYNAYYQAPAGILKHRGLETGRLAPKHVTFADEKSQRHLKQYGRPKSLSSLSPHSKYRNPKVTSLENIANRQPLFDIRNTQNNYSELSQISERQKLLDHRLHLWLYS